MPAPIDKSTGAPVTSVERRIRHLVGSLQKSQTKIIVPTPVLAEVLTYALRAGNDYFETISKSSAFRIEPFEIRAAIELAQMTANAIADGDKRGGLSGSWNKVKFDRQIVAIAKVTNVTTIYSDDEDLGKFARNQGIEVIAIGALPLPVEDTQMTLPWDENHVEEDANHD